MPVIPYLLQIQGMDALLSYLQLPKQTRLGFVPEMAHRLGHSHSINQDERRDSSIPLSPQDKADHQEFQQPTRKVIQLTRAELIAAIRQRNANQSLQPLINELEGKTPNVEVTGAASPRPVDCRVGGGTP